ncbi:hypothetical protein AGABI2DRAFT_177567, partial [Agaricus bisporus var. bisporus H97]|uniref:hypothetical protein n=1 Tax=Agaricus bisporus var. bisporus (strain H97 / ATCC MYA-4626 / FGSC 10389) TaxID=936046 RepID=UPI00029F6E06
MWLTIPLSSSLIATVAQLFYAHRIYILSRKKAVTVIVILLALTQLSFGLTSAAYFHTNATLANAISSLLGAVLWGAAGMTCDLVIAVYMSWFLTIQMKRSSRTTQVLLTRIKRRLLETGLLTAAMATAYPLLGYLVTNAFTIPG